MANRDAKTDGMPNDDCGFDREVPTRAPASHVRCTDGYQFRPLRSYLAGDRAATGGSSRFDRVSSNKLASCQVRRARDRQSRHWQPPAEDDTMRSVAAAELSRAEAESSESAMTVSLGHGTFVSVHLKNATDS